MPNRNKIRWFFFPMGILLCLGLGLNSKGARRDKGKRPARATVENKATPERLDSNPRLIKNQPRERFVTSVELQVLDKVTGKASKIEAKVGDKITFERLEILLLKCWKSFPEESPENKLLLKIFELNHHSGKSRRIFYGWIFSSTPSVSGLEHPLYDVKLRNCSE
ncbi:MAG: DUF2155 domain-containing protein [Rickettsiales bacterium]|jgi:hypothetical protein|nr:DUF2155 domain-containing protein [Rickettsiales bacterium]